jgi:hypothetical protein
MEDKKFEEAIAGLMKSDQREALAQMIVEYIEPNHITTDFISMILNTRNLAPGDSLVKKIRKGIHVHTWVPGQIGLKHEITVTDRINYILDSAIVGVMANEWELEAGEIGTVASLKAEAGAKLRDYYMNKVFTALGTVWGNVNTPNNYTNCGATITALALENMIDRINQTTSGAKAIIGVRSVVQPISKFAAFFTDTASGQTGFVPNRIEELMRTGYLGNYYGVPIIAINQVWDNPEDMNTLYSHHDALVIGENVGEFITFGPERSKEWTDMQPTPPYWHLDIVQQFGLMIDNAQGIGVLHTV